ncbi:MAG TPA: glycosyltransferase family 4 protein [Puia sp.]|nr:glycosyltransferase family 4 protein [Puia sp.]
MPINFFRSKPFEKRKQKLVVKHSLSRLAIVMTHPVQYYIPWIVEQSKQKVQLKVFYTWSQSQNGVIYDKGFGKNIQWDIPLLDGYDYTFVNNISKKPGVDHFLGIINPGLKEEIEAWNPDYIMIHGWNFQSHLKCIMDFHKKIPILFVGDSTLLGETKGIKKLARRIFLSWVYRHIDVACYPGTNSKDYFLKHSVKKEQLFYLPHSVNLDHFSGAADHNNQLAKKWKKDLGIPENNFVVLYAGKLIDVKNPGFLIELAAHCKNMGVTVLMVGNGPLENKLKAEACDYDNIKFLDFQNQKLMPVVYRMGDVFILPSTNETWGLCINEAMACERPVMVSSMAGCAVDLVEENKTGMIFEPDNISKCVEFIKKLNSDRVLANEMRNNAKKKADLFSVQTRIERFNSLVDFLDSYYDFVIRKRKRNSRKSTPVFNISDIHPEYSFKKSGKNF